MKLSGPLATVIAAGLVLVSGVVGAFLNPFASKLINPPEKTPDSASLAIEQLPATVFIYDGRDQNLGGWTSLSISYVDSAPNYQFNYFVPADQAGYAGMAFRFSEGQNLSKYKRVEFTLHFDGKEPEHVIDIYMTDIGGQKSYIRVTEIGDSQKKEGELLSNFAGVNLNAIKEITFNTDNTFVSGNHQVTISDINFVP
jgi:hypothetical protein